jgi:hypothetical protein
MDARRHAMPAVAFRYRATDFKSILAVFTSFYDALPSSYSPKTRLFDLARFGGHILFERERCFLSAPLEVWTMFLAIHL